MNIEVEIRSFISKQKYDELVDFFKKEGKFINKDDQITYYFDCKQDLRIQKNNYFSKIWLKKGKIHDEHREEIEIRFDKKDFEKLKQMFLAVGFNIEIKWLRKRHMFKWQDIDVMLDNTKGYGYIIELEKISNDKNKLKTLELLKTKLKTLNIELTPKEEFEKKFNYYKKNWRKLIV